jgi:hypothetical protein
MLERLRKSTPAAAPTAMTITAMITMMSGKPPDVPPLPVCVVPIPGTLGVDVGSPGNVLVSGVPVPTAVGVKV